MKEKEVERFAKALGSTKFRVFAQGDVLLLKCISCAPDVGASQLMLCITMAQGKMFSLSQISPILKVLVKQGLISASKATSEQTGRDMLVYTITNKGKTVLDLTEKILESLTRRA